MDAETVRAYGGFDPVMVHGELTGAAMPPDEEVVSASSTQTRPVVRKPWPRG